MMQLPNFKHEQDFWDDGCSIVAGVDEAGRGCLAGPVVVASVVFNREHTPIDLVRDSKTLSATQRERAYDLIIENAMYWSISQGSVLEIDSLNILQASLKHMQLSLQNIPHLEAALIDGNQSPPLPKSLKMRAIIRGDSVSYSIAAASILAKVHRDRLMKELHKNYPKYGWIRNMGYGTKEHREALWEHGVTPHHRKQFAKTVLEKQMRLVD